MASFRKLSSPRPHIARNGFSNFASSLCQIVQGLQIHPKFRASAVEAR